MRIADLFATYCSRQVGFNMIRYVNVHCQIVMHTYF
jgi:hypothetical protein